MGRGSQGLGPPTACPPPLQDIAATLHHVTGPRSSGLRPYHSWGPSCTRVPREEDAEGTHAGPPDGRLAGLDVVRALEKGAVPPVRERRPAASLPRAPVVEGTAHAGAAPGGGGGGTGEGAARAVAGAGHGRGACGRRAGTGRRGGMLGGDAMAAAASIR